ncbi:redox-regulated ATPase YchF [Candidatus Woesearchaeota archaeon]|nr:redox-regulated ATPase YchF [Candidatus Woesearchaeota archaeon]
MLIGVVGKANTGKSTFFKAATLMDIEIANYPFATIKPNQGIGFVSVPCVDKDFGVQCDPKIGYCREHQRFIAVDMIDVAGLVPGAHEGKGMGLEFLNDLNQADCLIHVIDASGSTNEGGEPGATGSYDPAKDIAFLEEELDHWYLNLLKKPWEKFARATAQTNEDAAKALHKQFSGLGSTEDMIKSLLKQTSLENKKLNEWSEKELFAFAKALRKHTKPMIIAANKLDLPNAQENLKKLKERFPEHTIVGCSAVAELALKEADKQQSVTYLPGDDHFDVKGELNEQQQKGLDYIKTNVLEEHGSTGVQDVINTATLDTLDNIAVWPVATNKLTDKDGNVLPDVFLLPAKSTAIEFAYKVHTDFGKNFIRAIHLQTKKTVGKDFALHHRDVIEIVADK